MIIHDPKSPLPISTSPHLYTSTPLFLFFSSSFIQVRSPSLCPISIAHKLSLVVVATATTVVAALYDPLILCPCNTLALHDLPSFCLPLSISSSPFFSKFMILYIYIYIPFISSPSIVRDLRHSSDPDPLLLSSLRCRNYA